MPPVLYNSGMLSCMCRRLWLQVWS
ncbi:hypothetical protein HID58_077970 [Brassica napus]|uniref:Uncharacterized protein n=1 Tax=Brassica napus TaxID=3708 RepID=A0ABQ7YRU7_BRANA|nr:hypothetical protein HID58_077970 [Brassica napus]